MVVVVVSARVVSASFDFAPHRGAPAGVANLKPAELEAYQELFEIGVELELGLQAAFDESDDARTRLAKVTSWITAALGVAYERVSIRRLCMRGRTAFAALLEAQARAREEDDIFEVSLREQFENSIRLAHESACRAEFATTAAAEERRRVGHGAVATRGGPARSDVERELGASAQPLLARAIHQVART